MTGFSSAAPGSDVFIESSISTKEKMELSDAWFFDSLRKSMLSV